jgi:glycosyltransferase involved in cell wall biosynthesis
MRILQVDLGRDMRGGQWQALSLVRALRGDAVLLAKAGSPLLERAIAEKLVATAYSPLDLLLASRRCDIAHAHDSRSHQWMAALVNVPFVVSRRVAFPIEVNVVNRWKYSRAAHFLAVSDFVKRTLITAQVPASKISVVYDGVDVPEETTTGGSIVAIETGDPMKGSALVREAASLGNFDVRFTSDLINDLRSADVFLYITHSEGLGSAALMAMAYGVAVVASRVGGLPEIVEDGVTGILTDNDPTSIVAAVRRARDRRAELGAKARVRVAAEFTTAKMVERTIEIYKKVLSV